MKSELRHGTKFIARRTFAGISGLRWSLSAAAPAAALRVLTYHDFCTADHDRDPTTVPSAMFRRQMSLLAGTRDVVPLNSLHAGPTPGHIGRSGICVTIDDGLASAIALAAPVLIELALVATFFVPTDYIGRKGHLSEADIRSLSDAGFEIGSHACSHRSITSLSPVMQRRELAASKRRLEDICGRAVTAFAYPFGTIRDFDASTERRLEEAGYVCAYTSQHGPVAATTSRFRLPRIKVEGGDSLALFSKAIVGGLDNWQWVDRLLSGLQMRADRSLPLPTASSGGDSGGIAV